MPRTRSACQTVGRLHLRPLRHVQDGGTDSARVGLAGEGEKVNTGAQIQIADAVGWGRVLQPHEQAFSPEQTDARNATRDSRTQIFNRVVGGSIELHASLGHVPRSNTKSGVTVNP